MLIRLFLLAYRRDFNNNACLCSSNGLVLISYLHVICPIIIIIIIIERKDLGSVMSKDCKDTLQTLKTVTKRECDAKWEQSICQMRSWAELSRSGNLRVNSSVFNWRLQDASEDNDVRDLSKLFHVRAAATGKARSPAVERRVVYCFTIA